MAGKLLDVAEAAKLLGVSPDQLSEMRQRGEIHGTRVGPNWKFKQEEVDRLLAEQSGTGDSDSSVSSDEGFDHLIPKPNPEEESTGEVDSVSILVSEEALGKSPETTSSTIIGKQRPDGADSDIRLVPDEGSDVSLATDAGGSDLKLVSGSGSDVLSGPESQLKQTGSGTGELSLESHDDLDLDSGEVLVKESDSAISLDEDSDELVLGGSSKGSGTGSDVSLDPAGSGINLTNPADSGLSLADEPLELAGSGVESLELPEDEDIISLNEMADPDQATQLKGDDEFLLSPMEDLGADESSDSGSQVIALEDSDSFDENAVTMLQPQGGPLLTEEPAGMPAQLGVGAGPAMTAQMTPQPQYITVQASEAPYKVVDVVLLILPVLSLCIAGMLMVDLLRNMWAFDQTTNLGTSVMDSVLSIVNLK